MTLFSPRPIQPGQTLRYSLPPCALWVARTPDECHVAFGESHPDACVGVDEAPAPESISWQRFALQNELDRISLRPALPDRPLVVRPASPLSILEGHTTHLFVSIPVGWQLECSSEGGEPILLTETPSTVLSKTWFGEPFAGEACYALKTRARHALSELSASHDRAICGITLRNRASERLFFERFCLRTPHLTLYRDPVGRLWTNDVEVVFTGSNTPAEVVHQHTPPVQAPEAERIAPPRKIAPRGFTSRAFGHMRTLGGIR